MALRQVTRYHQYRGNRRQTAPQIEPISLTELKTHLRFAPGQDDEDEYLFTIIQEATQEIEDRAALALIEQTWKLTLDHWPAGGQKWWDGVKQGHINSIYTDGSHSSVELPRYPLVSVDTVTVYSEDGTSSTVNIGNTFDIDTASLRGRLTLKRGATWPIALRANNAIEIDYTAGYGTAVTAVPAPLKRAIRNMAAYMYEHRGDGCDVKDVLSASGAQRIVDQYRVIEV